jgi:hypothetical protein
MATLTHAQTYELLESAARELQAQGYLKRFETDLTTHDRACIEALPIGARFFWAVGEHQTVFISKRADWSPYHSARKAILEVGCDHSFRCFEFDGEALHPIRRASEIFDMLDAWDVLARHGE